MKVLLVDDHQILLEGLVSFLESEADIEVVGLATSGKEALTIIDRKPPDVLITDIEMPGMDGIELTTKVKQLLPNIKVLALTMYNEQAYIKDMLRVGASGYILKNSGKDEFINAVRSVVEKGNYLSPEVMQNFIGSQKGKESAYGKKLSDREIEIVQLIANELTTEEIAEKLHLSAFTIKTHRKNILLKLGLKNSAGLIKYAMHKGLIS
ncbi:MAG: response regulator transcription factor [Bacteroidota bacterium]